MMTHTMKFGKEQWLRKELMIYEQQYGFIPRKNTMAAIFAGEMLMEKYRESQKELHNVF